MGVTWMVEGREDDHGIPLLLRARKVVVASGATSTPYMPSFTGSDDFSGPILHQTHFGEFFRTKHDEFRRVTVVGGGKSAADMVYTLAKSGKTVSWLIRKAGEGPGTFNQAAPTVKGPYLNGPELAATRLFEDLSPPCFRPQNWWIKLLHGTSRGRDIVRAVWNGADETARDIGRFHDREGALEGFQKLESDVK